MVFRYHHTTKYETPQGIPIQINITANRECVNYALCLYHLDNKRSTDRITEIFSYQNEYRFVVVDETENKETIRFDIGCLKDITTIMSKNEFLDVCKL